METRLIQALRCRCGAIYAGCTVPECYSEIEWFNDMRLCIKDGGSVEMIEAGTFKLQSCKCPKSKIEDEEDGYDNVTPAKKVEEQTPAKKPISLINQMKLDLFNEYIDYFMLDELEENLKTKGIVLKATAHYKK